MTPANEQDRAQVEELAAAVEGIVAGKPTLRQARIGKLLSANELSKLANADEKWRIMTNEAVSQEPYFSESGARKRLMAHEF